MRLAFVTLLLGVHSLWAVDQKPLPLPFGISAYVPAGWKAVAFATGDLNADGRSDFVLVCDDLDYDHVEDGTDNWPYSENPTRAMYVYFADAQGHVLKGKYHTLPYGYHFGSVSIKRGVIGLKFYNCVFDGGWRSEEDYKYQLERGRFRLIGSELAGGSTWGTARTFGSINYLTSRQKSREMSAYHPDAPYVWSDLPPQPALFLEDGFQKAIGR
jgi:hypothetical protein